eukprot:2606109-Ditylum_brightwellii.AAC.1
MEATAQIIKGQDIQGGDAAYSLAKSLLKGNALQVFQNKEASQEIKDGRCLLNALRLLQSTYSPGKQKSVPVEIRVQERRFDLSSSMLEEFLDVCARLEVAELQKLLRKTIALARKERDNDGKEKCQDKPKLHHERHHSSGKCHQGKRKKKYCNYH